MLHMEKDVIDRALESGDPATAEEAFREIDLRFQSLTSVKERADLLMRKAVLYEKVDRIDDARKQLRAALDEAPDDPDVRLSGLAHLCGFGKGGNSCNLRGNFHL
jgi:hypothetical protein